MAKSNDATLLSRRRMLSQSSMVLAMSALPATALAVTSASHPDARLLALGAELDALAPRLKAAFDRCAETHDAYRAICPPYPDVLRVTTEDAKMGLPKPWGHRDGRFYTPGDLCDLRNHSTCRSKEIPLAEFLEYPAEKKALAILFEGKTVRVSVPQPDANARRLQIIAALEEWSRASNQHYADVGYTAAEQRTDALTQEQSGLLNAIAAEPATTLEGLMVKARAIGSLYDDEDEIEADDSTDAQLMVSIVRDMLKGQFAGAEKEVAHV